jgi:hypothetical protein
MDENVEGPLLAAKRPFGALQFPLAANYPNETRSFGKMRLRDSDKEE